MPETHNFEHLPLLMRQRGPARLTGRGNPTPQTVANRQSTARHSAALQTASGDAIREYKQFRDEREAEGRPVLPSGIPLLLQVDPGLDLDALRHYFEFEIISEEEEGYVIVASEDLDLTVFAAAVAGFAVQLRGTATIAQGVAPDPRRSGARCRCRHRVRWHRRDSQRAGAREQGH
jgi:hypothetical protein